MSVPASDFEQITRTDYFIPIHGKVYRVLSDRRSSHQMDVAWISYLGSLQCLLSAFDALAVGGNMHMPDILNMCSKRGALIVLEGCDRAGKSTQVKLLTKALNDLSIPVEARAFPNRKTPIGSILNSFLSKKINVPPEAAHLLFSANRWECKEDIEKTLLSGTTVVIDRYASSGAAYTAANTGRCLEWCRQPDLGLPKPDCIVLLKVSKRQQELRHNWGKERFESDQFQALVDANYEQLRDDTWINVDADQNESTVHFTILQKVLSTIQEAQHRRIELLGS